MNKKLDSTLSAKYFLKNYIVITFQHYFAFLSVCESDSIFLFYFRTNLILKRRHRSYPPEQS